MGCRRVVRLRDGDSEERLPLKTFTGQKNLLAESAVQLLVNYYQENPSVKELLYTEYQAKEAVGTARRLLQHCQLPT